MTLLRERENIGQYIDPAKLPQLNSFFMETDPKLLDAISQALPIVYSVHQLEEEVYGCCCFFPMTRPGLQINLGLLPLCVALGKQQHLQVLLRTRSYDDLFNYPYGAQFASYLSEVGSYSVETPSSKFHSFPYLVRLALANHRFDLAIDLLSPATNPYLDKFESYLVEHALIDAILVGNEKFVDHILTLPVVIEHAADNGNFALSLAQYLRLHASSKFQCYENICQKLLTLPFVASIEQTTPEWLKSNRTAHFDAQLSKLCSKSYCVAKPNGRGEHDLNTEPLAPPAYTPAP